MKFGPTQICSMCIIITLSILAIALGIYFGTMTNKIYGVAIDEEIENAEMSAGSVFIYTGSVMHGGGANQTSENRLGVFLHYAPNWLRQEENQYLSCPPSIAKELEPELRDLMGYSQGGYVLGFFTDPTDTEGKLESVSPKKLFGEDVDPFKIASSEELVKSSTKKN